MERAVIAPPAGYAPAVFYFTIANRGSVPNYLVDVAVEGASQSTMHDQLQHQVGLASTTQMIPLASVAVEPGATVAFKPGGRHVESVGFAHPPNVGDSLRVTLRFARGSVSGVAPVLRYEDLDTALTPLSMRARLEAALMRILVAAGCSSCRRAVAPSVSHGRFVYLANGCATCHGPDGHGDGPVAKTLVPPPRDFRSAAYRGGTDAASIARTISEGVYGGGSMPRFAHLSSLERRSLALYLISLRIQP